MRIPIYQVDAFSRAPFGGNPAAVCPLERWLDDATLLAIAAENNLSETAFFCPAGRGDGDGADYALRWFTPAVEIDLCGHATLASAYVLFEHLERGRASVTFSSKSGPLTVTREGDLLALDFPARPAEPCEVPAGLGEALGAAPSAVLRSRDVVAVFDDADVVRRLQPDIRAVAELDAHAVIVTAPGGGADFVSRFFGPRVGVPEDPVTGSAHCTLVPYWSRRLGKQRLHALQVSRRGGELFCEDRGERVAIAGRAALYLEGTITIPD